MIQMNESMKEKQTHKHREQTCRCQGEGSGGEIHWEFGVVAAAKSLQSCPTLCDPIDGSLPGSPVPGFSRQEHWSGLPFPLPTHESEK